MKIIKPGKLAKDGIYETCPYCKGEFIVESREDIQTKKIYDIADDKYYYSYSILCPCCEDYVLDLFIDPHEKPRLFNPCPEFNRPDWKERFAYKEE